MKVEIGNATLYLGDCMDILPTLDKVDAVITDPPYGINFKYESHDDNLKDWENLINITLPMMKTISKFVVMPACQIKRLGWWYKNHEPDWLICWHKGSHGHLASIGFNDWEPHVCFGKPPRMMHDYFSMAGGWDDNGHPCPKPLRYADWLVDRSTKANNTVLDPFMGSGTTGVAAIQLGRKFIGIEREPKYFEIACKRIEQAVAQGQLFEPEPVKPIQESMF